jgi:hypothetical protein
MGKQTFSQTKKILGILLIVFFVAALTAPAISAYQTHYSNNVLQFFYTERAAQHYCPSDTVVWLNLRTGVYHFKDHYYYGNTKKGAYVCQIEADQAGNRPADNEYQYGGHHQRSVGHHRRGYYYNNRPRAHYYLGQYYPNCDWVWNSYTYQWIWTC